MSDSEVIDKIREIANGEHRQFETDRSRVCEILRLVASRDSNKSNRVSPVDGGCWFCNTLNDVDDGAGWLFSTEFDCFLHKSCLLQALAPKGDGSSNQEANIMGREFGLVTDDR